eukprot:1196282-Prorocentrum_minimum.AAC.7
MKSRGLVGGSEGSETDHPRRGPPRRGPPATNKPFAFHFVTTRRIGNNQTAVGSIPKSLRDRVHRDIVKETPRHVLTPKTAQDSSVLFTGDGRSVRFSSRG